MEQDINFLHQINSLHDSLVLQTSITCLDKKRKLQAEQLGIPPSKHVCASRSLAIECDTSTPVRKTIGLFGNIAVGDMEGMAKADYSEAESAKDSNSIGADAESFMCTSVDAETDEVHSKEYTSEQLSPWLSNWSSNCSSGGLYSLGSRSLIESGLERSESAVYNDIDDTYHDFGVHSPLNAEEHVLEFGGHVDKGLEELLYANGVTPKSLVLSSGKLIVNGDSQRKTKTLTIDKEFEQYFSALML